ncbi:uncharacterized protein LOC130809726 [Amaranthus tricolor]|uniref:uncharacterized protein LOC130809726 n=1 Tax=Amaranthus tricolor TaxID=29722 RepID=UPI00258CEE31|nr:uncharacterized protein LOC130809726 [Amaranthus tricolor]
MHRFLNGVYVDVGSVGAHSVVDGSLDCGSLVASVLFIGLLVVLMNFTDAYAAFIVTFLRTNNKSSGDKNQSSLHLTQKSLLVWPESRVYRLEMLRVQDPIILTSNFKGLGFVF